MAISSTYYVLPSICKFKTKTGGGGGDAYLLDVKTLLVERIILMLLGF
jgi:hypothetical protein